jgi:putative NADPH-quinone reductase
MKVNVVYAHPAADSYNASLHQRIVQALEARGDEVIDFDLHGMKFDPTMGEEEWRGHEVPSGPTPPDLQVYIDALKWADACVFCFPTWWCGMPAIMKGYFDRVWRPGVAFDAPPGGLIRPALRNIRKIGVVTTCGSPWWYTRLFTQDPGRKVLLRGLAATCAGFGVKQLYLAQHSVYDISQEARERFAHKVEQRFARF